MGSIQIIDKINAVHLEAGEFDERPIRQAADRTLQERQEPGEVSLTIVITGDDELQRLNFDYLGVDHPTDVLAFPSGEVDPDQEVLYLGDVVISYPRAEAQAQAGGHGPLDEVRLLVIHGILHLLGYDHGDPDAKTRMWAVQETILADLGIAVTVRE